MRGRRDRLSATVWPPCTPLAIISLEGITRREPMMRKSAERPRPTFANCASFELGSREVVINTRGSSIPACEYSSSMWVRGAVGEARERSTRVSARSCSGMRSAGVVGVGAEEGTAETSLRGEARDIRRSPSLVRSAASFVARRKRRELVLARATFIRLVCPAQRGQCR